jgi:hypothetical protein
MKFNDDPPDAEVSGRRYPRLIGPLGPWPTPSYSLRLITPWRTESFPEAYAAQIAELQADRALHQMFLEAEQAY